MLNSKAFSMQFNGQEQWPGSRHYPECIAAVTTMATYESKDFKKKIEITKIFHVFFMAYLYG
uniref:Uncharacterized protein n=1 Tax=Anguilla anguilla TaxID=7936 RepID=A0A0E9T944_ANGAN